jgi:hypothetical protein
MYAAMELLNILNLHFESFDNPTVQLTSALLDPFI